MCCRPYQEIRLAEEVLERDGHHLESETKHGEVILRPHPAIRVKLDAEGKLRAWLTEFGLTPSSRSRVRASRVLEDDPAARYFER